MPRARSGAPEAALGLDEIERVARIGSYVLDIASGRWVSSPGLDAIFGIDAGFERSIEGWASLIAPADRAAMVAYLTDEVLGAGNAFDRQYRVIRADTGEKRWVHGRGALQLDGSGRPVRMLGTSADITEVQRAMAQVNESESERTAAPPAFGNLVSARREIFDAALDQTGTGDDGRFRALLDAAPDAVVVIDGDGTIVLVNEQTEMLFRYKREEVVGQPIEMLLPERFRGAHIGHRRRYIANPHRRPMGLGVELAGRGRDGTEFPVEISLSSLSTAESGTLTMAFIRDTSERRAADAVLAAAMAQVNESESERIALSAALALLQPGPTLDATATVICKGLLSLSGIDLAAVVNFLGPERAVPLAVAGPADLPFDVGEPIPTSRAAYLYQRAQLGPWADVFENRVADPLREQLERFGLQASAYAPIRNGGGLLGVVVAATRDPVYALHLVEHLPAVSEFAATASALLSAQIEAGHHELRAREHVGHVLAEHGFRPVFQPIVDLASGGPVGFEALTRFTDGTPPDRMIAEAHQAGLGLELELACLSAALDASETLPAGAWLSLNAAPAVILQTNDLAALLAGRRRKLVLEVTEHAPIDDYAALRQAVAGLGVDLAVDDAGSGFASLRHIVELAPRYLKLDVSLVRHVDRDITRQAMAAGMYHFASRIGCEVIAEGIEDAAELAMLLELGVPFGQGYLLGRPAPPPAMPQGTRQLGAKDPRPARSA